MVDAKKPLFFSQGTVIREVNKVSFVLLMHLEGMPRVTLILGPHSVFYMGKEHILSLNFEEIGDALTFSTPQNECNMVAIQNVKKSKLSLSPGYPDNDLIT